MWQNNEDQRGNRPPTFRRVLIGNANQQLAAGTQAANNVSGTGTWISNVPLSSIATATIALPQQTGLPNPPPAFVPISFATATIALPQQTGLPNLPPAFVPISYATGLPISIDQRNRAVEFCEASTSSRPKKISRQPANAITKQISSLMAEFSNESEVFFNNFIKTINEGVKQSKMRYLKSMVACFRQMASKSIQAKEAELQNAYRRNSVLEKSISKLRFENQNLLNLASEKEMLVSQPKTSFKQAETGFTTDAAEAPPPAGLLPAIEGIGDTDGKHEQSYFKIEDVMAETNEKVYGRLTCRVCRKKESSIVVLYCNHLCLCMECETKVDRCPICNSSKYDSIHIILP